MNIRDIAKVKIDWMERYANDPRLEIVLKRDRKLIPWENFRFRQYGDLYFACMENEVRFVKHNARNHEGFGGARYVMRMEDSYRSEAGIVWPHCTRQVFEYDPPNQCLHGKNVTRVSCHYDSEANTVTLFGPWSSNESYASQVTGVECIHVSVLDGPSRLAISHPKDYNRMQRQGRAYDGTYFATAITLDFAREAVDTFAPHAEMWQGDYGWTVKRRGMDPKNPRRLEGKPGHSDMAGEQLGAIYA